MTKQILLLFAFLAVSNAIPAWGDEKEPSVKHAVIIKTADGGPKTKGELVLQSAKDWKAFIATCTSPKIRAALTKRKIDFRKKTIIAVAQGDNRSILGSPHYEKLSGVQDVRQVDGKVVVAHAVIHSDHLSIAPMYPLNVISVPKTKKVEFRREAKVFAG